MRCKVKKIMPAKEKPFLFLTPWLQYPEFGSFLCNTWQSIGTDFSRTVAEFVEKAVIWKRDIFGHIKHRKNRCLA